MPSSASVAPVTDLATQIERHVEGALGLLQTPDVRANASWLPGLPAVTNEVERLERSAAAELLQRVADDRSALADAFTSGRDLGTLTDVRLGQSDPHNGRRTVALLRFANGPTIVYKPRSVAMEAAFARLTDWVAARDEELAPRAPFALERLGYGYCEYVRHRPCSHLEDVERFYCRLGALARLLAEVRATDCHPGNVVAEVDRPVLVDAETLLHPSLRSTPTRPLHATEILPSRTTTSRGQAIVYGGFDAPLPEAVNRPVLDDRHQQLAEHRPSFDRGVARMDAVLAAQPHDIAAPDGPLQLAPGACTRVVLRPTQMYGRLLQHRLSARSLASEDGGWPTVDRLLRRYEDDSLSPTAWDVVRTAEQAALHRVDIPYFLADARSGDLLDGDGRLLAARAFSRNGMLDQPPPADSSGSLL